MTAHARRWVLTPAGERAALATARDHIVAASTVPVPVLTAEGLAAVAAQHDTAQVAANRERKAA